MSKLGKLRKNAQSFNLKEMYSNMTPEDYRNGIKMAVESAVRDLAIEYDKNINKLKNEYESNLKYSTIYAIDTLSVELLYELANQLGCFEENPDFLEDKIYRVKEIYENTMNSIKGYVDFKTDEEAQKEFTIKKKKVEGMFDIEFDIKFEE